MQECWYALVLAIQSPIYHTPEMAFQSLDNGAPSKHNNTLTDADFEDMLVLKSDLRYKDLAEIYGVETTCLFKRIKTFEKNKIKERKTNEINWNYSKN